MVLETDDYFIKINNLSGNLTLIEVVMCRRRRHWSVGTEFKVYEETFYDALCERFSLTGHHTAETETEKKVPAVC